MLYFNLRFLTLLSLLLSFDAYAQRYRNGVTELGLFVGASNYSGDIAPEIVWAESHPAIGLMYKYHHSKYFSSRYQFTYASISGSDQNFSANAYRNISFESNIYELGYNLEFNFKPFGINANQHEENKTTFVFAGFNMFMFNPVHRLPSGDKLELRDIGTEGQKVNDKRQYSLIQPSLTLGLGYKFNVKRRTVIGLEIGFRKTFTDYLDDTKGQYVDYNTIVAKQGVGAGDYSHTETLNNKKPITGGSMRGDPALKDWYFMVGLTISFRNVVGDPCSGL